ncbi:MAG: hypothetical protein HYT46_01470 [Candidatus Vogelbacteria bacterium]|nr:hypothetical protein [Candidatus Vogelbacteria bacterium]
MEKKKSQVTFTEATAAAVSAFQLKYAKEILAPLGLANPTGYVGPSTRKVLNRLYGCGSTVPPKPIPPDGVVRVLSPNGGEYLTVGKKININWAWRGTASDLIDIHLVTSWNYEKNGPNSSYGIASRIPNTGSYEWTVGQTLGGFPLSTDQGYWIEVCVWDSVNYATRTCDASDSYFKIVTSDYTGNKPPTISGVEGPTALKIGETGTWSVQASDPENGTLSYSVIWGDETMVSGGVAYAPTVEKIQQTATFTHSYAQAGTYYPKFRVTDNAGQSNSTSLSVVVGGGGVNPPVPSPVQIFSPNGGESWQKGFSYPIQWKTNATDVFIRISISNFSGNWYPVYSKTENDGVEYWTIPSTIKSGTYWMSVSLCRSDNDCYWNDWSDSSFKIYDSTTVNPPNQPGLDFEVMSFELNKDGPFVRFCNRGTYSVNSFPVWITVNGVVIKGFNMHGHWEPMVNCGLAHQWYYATWGFNAMPSTGYSGEVIVDPENLYAETNENNNKATAYYKVEQPQPVYGGARVWVWWVDGYNTYKIKDAKVWLYSADNNQLLKSGVTVPYGSDNVPSVYFGDLKSGKYYVKASAVGYTDGGSAIFVVEAGREASVTVDVKPVSAP